MENVEITLEEIEKALDDNTEESREFAVNAGRGRKDLSKEIFMRLVSVCYDNPRLKLVDFYAPVLVTYDWVRKYIRDGSDKQRFLAIAFCLGREDVPIEILEYCLNDCDAKFNQLAFAILETTCVPYRKILEWSESENLNFQIGALRYHKNSRFLDYEVAEKACGAFGCLPGELRDELAKKICAPIPVLKKWFDSEDLDLKSLGISVCDNMKCVDWSLVGYGIHHEQPDVNQAMYRLCARFGAPRRTVEFWLVRGGEEYTTAALAAYSKIGGAPQKLIERILTNFTGTPPIMRYYAQKIYDNHLYVDDTNAL